MNVVVLRHHAKDHVGLVGEELASRGATIHSLLCGPGFSGAFPDIDDVELIIVLGSTFSVYDAEVRANWLSREIEYLDEARSRGLAIWGICFGAQILCLMSGGEVAEAPESEVGWYLVESLPNDAVPPGPWFRCHYDHCLVSEAVRVRATSPAAVQVFTFERHVAVQFHPEIEATQLAQWLQVPDVRAPGMSGDELIATAERRDHELRAQVATLISAMLAWSGLG